VFCETPLNDKVLSLNIPKLVQLLAVCIGAGPSGRTAFPERSRSIPNLKSKIANPKSLNHLGRLKQDLRRNSKAYLLGGLQVNYQLKFRWVLHREVSGLGAF